MATINLSWTPASGTNVTGQLVQRKTSTTSFSTIVTLNATASSYSDTTAANNTVYLYQIVTQCAVGGPTDGADVCAAKLVCPTITTSVTLDDVNFTLPAIGGQDVIYTTVQIFAPGLISAHLENVNSAGPYTFTRDLEWDTAYTYTVTIQAVGCTQVLTCTGSFTIPPQPACAAVTGLTATVI